VIFYFQYKNQGCVKIDAYNSKMIGILTIMF